MVGAASGARAGTRGGPVALWLDAEGGTSAPVPRLREDEYTGGDVRARWSAEQAKAEVAVLQGLGHWWMIQDPAAGAAALKKFWAD